MNVNVSKHQGNHGSMSRDGMRTEPDFQIERCGAPIRDNGQGGKKGESAGEEYGSVVGCYANTWNPQASLRTANCNNHAGNGNDNYGGAFAVDKEKGENGKYLSAQPTRLNNKENCAVTDAHGQCEYSSNLPFFGSEGEESNAELSIREELRIANSGRKLKNPRTGEKELHVSGDGSMEIKEFGKLVDDGVVSLPLALTVMHDGKSTYFREFHTTEKEACEAILACAEGIDF